MRHSSDDPRSPAPPAASARPALWPPLFTDCHAQEPLPHQLRPRLHRHRRHCRSGRSLPPPHCEGTSETPLLLAAYAEESGPGDGGGPASERGLWAHQTLCPEGHSDLDLSQSVNTPPGLPDLQPLTAALQKKTDRIPLTAAGDPRLPRPPPPPRRGQYYSASPSTSMAASAPRVSFRQRGPWGGSRGRGSEEPPFRRKVVPNAAAAAAGPARLKRGSRR